MNNATGIYYCDTEDDYITAVYDLETNPDFSELGYYDSINDIYDEMEYQGFTEDQIRQLTVNRYGSCLEIIEFEYRYTVYIGSR